MAKRSVKPKLGGPVQLGLPFTPTPADPQPTNNALETILDQSTIPEFLKQAPRHIDYPSSGIASLLSTYFPGDFGDVSRLSQYNKYKLKGMLSGVYEYYKNIIGFLSGAIGYSPDAGYISENAGEKLQLMRQYLGAKTKKELIQIEKAPNPAETIGLYFNSQVKYYQELISQNGRKK